MAFQITDIQKKFHQSYSQHKEHLAEKKQVSDSNPKGWVALFFFPPVRSLFQFIREIIF